jgi:FAD synthetase
MYIPIPSPFPTLESFIDDTVKVYNVDLWTPTNPQLNGVDAGGVRQSGAGGMLQALHMYKKQFPNITGILIGTRRNDPHGGTHVLLSF